MMDDRVYEKAAGKGEPWIEWGGLTLIHKDGKPIYVENVQVVEEDGRIFIRPDLGAVWTARYGCPQCAGTGIVPVHDGRCDGTCREGACPQPDHCPSEHVQMVNPHTREQVQCDPAKAEWRHAKIHNYYQGLIDGERCTRYGCGWVPVPEGSGEQR